MNPKKPTRAKTIGILSDTHGLVRPEVEKALAGCDQILHAGDVDIPQVLKRLQRIAPVTAVRGNMDRGPWSNVLPVTAMVQIEGVFFYILHDLHHLDLEPSAAGIHVVVSGHIHQPDIFEKDGVIYLNPGSAGQRRYDYPVSVAIVRVENGGAFPQIVKIDV
ncbi:metallophosphoesterase family protein [Desulfosarcina sp.]|uniref:metallophosphoesterase family protein n=1 Tax=Desulfosarcina sp. TaxID=2027861 RepID=UPI0039707CCA